jgi:hypothetical protein
MLLTRGLSGDRARARELLVAATELYERLGMSPWVARASELSAVV